MDKLPSRIEEIATSLLSYTRIGIIDEEYRRPNYQPGLSSLISKPSVQSNYLDQSVTQPYISAEQPTFQHSMSRSLYEQSSLQPPTSQQPFYEPQRPSSQLFCDSQQLLRSSKQFYEQQVKHPSQSYEKYPQSSIPVYEKQQNQEQVLQNLDFSTRSQQSFTNDNLENLHPVFLLKNNHLNLNFLDY